MPSIDTDTRLIMTILFVGSVSGVNVYFYTQYGVDFPYGGYAHGVLFGIITIGAIMIMKAAFDLMLHDIIEDRLLQRNIDSYWLRKARDEENRKRVRESMRNFQQNFAPVYGDANLPTFGQTNKAEEQNVSPAFLTELR